MTHKAKHRIFSIFLSILMLITGVGGMTASAQSDPFSPFGGDTSTGWESWDSFGFDDAQPISEGEYVTEEYETEEQDNPIARYSAGEEPEESEQDNTPAATSGTTETPALGASGYGEYMEFTIPWERDTSGGFAPFASAFTNLGIRWIAGYDYNYSLAPGYPVWGQWCVYTADGKVVYCLEPKNLVSTDGKLLASNTSWSGLSNDQKLFAGYIMCYGNTDGANIPEHIATQALIWEVCLGYRDYKTFSRTSNYIYNGIISGKAAQSYYTAIENKVKTHALIASFMGSSAASAPTYVLSEDGGGFKLAITDSKNILADFNFPSIPGVTFSVSGSKLTITSTGSIDPAQLVDCLKKGGESGGSGEGLVFWLVSAGAEQVKGYYDGSLDPKHGYFKIATTGEPDTPTVTEDEEYEISIIKRVEGTNELLPGAEFEVRHTSHGVVGTFITDDSGGFTVKVPWAGTYIITEIACPAGFVMPDDPDAELYVDKDNPTAERTFFNAPYTGIEVCKVDYSTGQRLAGAIIKITEISTGMTYTKTTGTDGIAMFSNLRPNDYSVQEIQAPNGYVLNDTVYPVSLESNKLASVTIQNQRKFGLYIRKVDPDGQPIQGAVFELRRGSGEVLIRETTDPNGLIYRGNLTTDTYVVEEIQAPTGYILDPNNPQSIYINTSDDNKEYVLTFVNQRKPAIEILKVDADNPNTVLFGATFRISEQGGSKTWDITTNKNGLAKLENLDENMTYLVEEIIAPNGYVNSGYKEAIVLEAGKTHRITVANKALPSLTLLKKNKDTGAPLAGATFRVARADGSEYQDVTTDGDGKAVITGLVPDWYTVTEIKAPDGFLLDDTVHTIQLEDGKDAVLELFNEQKPALQIIKLDSVVRERLPNATFKIFRKDSGSEIYIGEYTTDQNGEIVLGELIPGRYLIRETIAPDGYNIDQSEREITLDYGKVVNVEFFNTPKSPLFIQKIDETGAPLMGAKFLVKTMNGGMVGTYTTGHNGYAIVPYAAPGWYVVEEVQAPDGYVLSAAPVNVELKSGIPATVEFVNVRKPQLSVLKLDSADNKALMGAKIKITKANGELIGTYTTDSKGLVTLAGLEAGSYIVSEITAPDGYILDMTPQTVELKAGETKQIELFNTAKPGLQLRKLDKLTMKPVKNAVFDLVRLESGAKRDLGTFTTGENGLFFVPDLAPGNYVLTEIKAPDGYILDSTPQNIYIEAGKLNTVEVLNVPYASLRLVKISADDYKPLSGAIFKLYDEKRLEIGTYETSVLGEIIVPQIPAGTYYLQEVKAPAGFILDSTVHKIELIGGKTTTVEIKNTALGTLRILKKSAEDGKPLYGAAFLLYDNKNNLLGEYTTDQNGIISFGRSVTPGVYKIKEIKAPAGFVLDETIRTVTVRDGETTEIVIENAPQRGKVQVLKTAAADSTITKIKKGAALSGAVFEIFNERLELVDTITTDKRGMATSKDLPLGKYVMKEIQAPEFFYTNGENIYFEIKLHDDLIRFAVENQPEEIEVSVEKRGVVECMAGDVITYDFAEIANKSNCDLEAFYWHDLLPTDAVRIQTLNTGTWNQRVQYDVWVKTNLKNWKKVKSNLHGNTEYTVDLSGSALGLASNEYVTEYKLEFGKVGAGFKEEKAPFITCKVLDTLPRDYRFTNKTDVGGRRGKEWSYDRDSWTTIVYGPKRPLPKTGF